MKWYVSPPWYMNSRSCVSIDAGSIESAARKRCSKLEPVRRFLSFACTIARKFPGVWWRNSTMRHGSPSNTITMPRRIWVAGIAITLNSIGKTGEKREEIRTKARQPLNLDSVKDEVKRAGRWALGANGNGRWDPRSPLGFHARCPAPIAQRKTQPLQLSNALKRTPLPDGLGP